MSAEQLLSARLAHAGGLIARRLMWSEQKWRQVLPSLPREQRLALFDSYMELADWLNRLPRSDGAVQDRRRRARDNLRDFAWRLNDLVAELHARLRDAPRQRLPRGAATILAARRRGRVPGVVGGFHASIGLRSGFRAAAPGAFLVVPAGAEYRNLHFGCLAGLDVEILVTKIDLLEVDPLARELAAQGVVRIVLRCLDNAMPPAILYDGSRPWRR